MKLARRHEETTGGHMPASVLIVHREPDALEMLLQAVRKAGHDAAAFSDPLSALSAIEVDSRVRVLITRLDFGPGKLNGLALARMLRLRKSEVAVIFVGRPEKASSTDSVSSCASS